MYYSNNGGTTWQQASGSNAYRIWDVEINAVNTNMVYAVGHKAPTGGLAALAPIVIFRSTDGGASFTEVNSASFNNVYSTKGARFGVTPANGNTVYCITLDDATPKLLKSTDAGVSWSIRATGNTQSPAITNGQGFYDLDILVSPNNENHLITGTFLPHKSVDGGVTFSLLTDAGFPIHADLQCMRAAGNDAYLCNDGGFNHSTDFFTSVNNFSARNNGLTGSEYWGFDQGWDQDIVVGGRYHNGNAALFQNYGKERMVSAQLHPSYL